MHVVQEQKQTLFLLADDFHKVFWLYVVFFIATRGRQGDKGVRGSVCDVAQMLDLS